MATVKKSLTVNELADKIKLAPKGTNASKIMADLRTKYTFSKDKWNTARKLITAVKAEEPVKPAKKPVKATATIECFCEDCREQAEDEFFDMVDYARDEAEKSVGCFFASLKEKSMIDPHTIMIPACCPAARPEVFRLLDLGVESGLLDKHIGYSLSEAALEQYRKQRKAEAKKKAKKK